MRKTIVAGLVAVTAIIATAGTAQAATPKERALARQVKTLKAQNATLKRELASERARLSICQTSASAAISTMTPMQAATLILPPVVTVFENWKDRYGEDGPNGYYASASKSEMLSNGQLDDVSFYFSIGGLAPINP
jgi:hypothetical protein